MNTLINLNIDVVLNDLSRQTGKALDARDDDGSRFEDLIPKETERSEVDRTSRTEKEIREDAPGQEESYEREPVDEREYTEGERKNSLPLNNAHDSSKSRDAQAASADEAKRSANQDVSRVDGDDHGEPTKHSQDGSSAPEQQAAIPQQNEQINLAGTAAHLERLLQESLTVGTVKPETEPVSTAAQSASLKVQSASEFATASSVKQQTAKSSDSVGKVQVADKPAVVDTVVASVLARAASNGLAQSPQQGLPVQAALTAQLNVQNPIAEQAKVDPQSVAAQASASANRPNASGAALTNPAEPFAVPADTDAKPNQIPTPQGRHDPLANLNVGQRSADEPNLKNDINVPALLTGRTGQAASRGSNARGATTIKTQAQSTTEAAPSPNAATQQDQTTTAVKFTPVPQALATAADVSSGDTMTSRDFGQTSTSGIPEIAGRPSPLNQSTIAAARSALPISNSAAVLNQIALQISKNVSDGTVKFEILMDPPELGRIEVRMELNSEGRLQAHLLADKQETLDLMQRDARQLEKALGDLGVDADSDSLEFSLRDEDQADGFTNRSGDETQHEGADSDKEIELLSLPPDLNVGTTMETYGFKVRELIGISLNV